MRPSAVAALLASLTLLAPVTPLTTPALAQPAGASPERQRLADALAGDWRTVETMERSPLFPNGAGRHGTTRTRLATGGATLVQDGHSDGSAGPLDYHIVIWWDSDAAVYRLLTCFRAGTSSGCIVRGTAHWDGRSFVNDYADTIDGKSRPFRDTFFDITPTSYTLTESVDSGDGTMRALITTRSVRAH
jgi:hypothetical protein